MPLPFASHSLQALRPGHEHNPSPRNYQAPSDFRWMTAPVAGSFDPMQYEIDADITRAATMPGAFYVDAAAYERLRERVFARSWQLVGDLHRAPEPQTTWPFAFLPGCVEEPLVLTRTAGGASHVLSNVCTHRANLVCVEAGRAEGLRCRYH